MWRTSVFGVSRRGGRRFALQQVLGGQWTERQELRPGRRRHPQHPLTPSTRHGTLSEHRNGASFQAFIERVGKKSPLGAEALPNRALVRRGRQLLQRLGRPTASVTSAWANAGEIVPVEFGLRCRAIFRGTRFLDAKSPTDAAGFRAMLTAARARSASRGASERRRRRHRLQFRIHRRDGASTIPPREVRRVSLQRASEPGVQPRITSAPSSRRGRVHRSEPRRYQRMSSQPYHGSNQGCS